MAVKFRADQIPSGLKVFGGELPSEFSIEDAIKIANKIGVQVIDKPRHIVLNVCPMGKPRMTQSDKWKKRPAVVRYRELCDQFREECYRQGYSIGEIFSATFVLPMPSSWSKKKREQLDGSPHRAKPDCDNIVKFCLDAGLEDDSKVHTLKVNKIWGEQGKIIIYL